MPPSRITLAALLVLAMLSGCSDDDSGDSSPGTDQTTAVTPSGTDDTTSPADLASGSGCTPPPGDELPDGRWFGVVADQEAGSEPGSPVLAFDLACWFDGEAAVVAATEDGAESPPPNDYHIRNDNPLVRLLPIDPDVEVRWLATIGDPATMAPIDLADWRTERAETVGRPGIWIDIDGGLVVTIEEQYVP